MGALDQFKKKESDYTGMLWTEMPDRPNLTGEEMKRALQALVIDGVVTRDINAFIDGLQTLELGETLHVQDPSTDEETTVTVKEAFDKIIKLADDELTQEIQDRIAAVTAERNARIDAVTAEQERAEGAETTLQDNISAETQARITADNAERERATTAETEIANSVIAEQQRATTAESALQANINAESTERGSAITAERQRAQGVEQGLRTDLTAEVARAQAAENLKADKTTIDKGFIKSTAFFLQSAALSFRTTIQNILTGSTTTQEETLPLASSSNHGVMPRESFSQIATNTADIESLKGRGLRYYVDLPSEEPTQTELMDAFQTKVGRAPNEGETIVDEGHGFEYVYSQFDGNFHKRSIIAIGPFGIGIAGTVTGKNEEGFIFPEHDGSGSVVGYDALKDTANNAFDLAEQAIDDADFAVDAAEEAKDTADAANTKANDAFATAQGASTAANLAVGTAETANTNAGNAIQTANQANTTAGNALSTAQGANTTAGNALSTAQGANTTAGNALTAAQNANTAAVNAQTTANEAKGIAENAGGKKYATFVVGLQGVHSEKDVDYLADPNNAQIAINAAIQALPSGGGKMLIREGTYNLTDRIIVNKDNTTIEGMGNNTKLVRKYASANTSQALVCIRSSYNIIQKIYIEGNSAVYTEIYNIGILIEQAFANNTITNIVCNNSGYGIRASESINNNITGNMFKNNYYGIVTVLSKGNNIMDNIFNGTGHTSIDLSTGDTENTITGNTCTNSAYASIALSYGANNNVVAGNTCNNTTSFGINLTSSKGNTITGNTCNNNGCGINLVSGNINNNITGNIFMRGSGTSADYTSSQYTILVQSTTNNYNLIADNNIMGKNYSSSGGTGNTFVNNKYN